MKISQCLDINLRTDSYSYETKHPGYIMLFGVIISNGDIMPPFIFPHGLRLNMEDLHQVAGGSSAALHKEGGC